MKKNYCPQCSLRIGTISTISLFIGFLKSCPACGTKIRFESSAKFHVIFQNVFTVITATAVIIFKNNSLLLITAIPFIFLVMFAVNSYYAKLSLITPEEAVQGREVIALDLLKQCLYFPLRIVPVPLIAYAFIQDQNIDWYFYSGFIIALVIVYYWLWRDLKSGRASLIKIRFNSDV